MVRILKYVFSMTTSFPTCNSILALFCAVDLDRDHVGPVSLEGGASLLDVEHLERVGAGVVNGAGVSTAAHSSLAVTVTASL